MTENPNTQPEPNAGQPPGGPVDRPATSEPPTPSAARPSEGVQPGGPTGSTRAAGSSEAAEAAEAAGAAGTTGDAGAAKDTDAEAARREPAAGTFAETPWVEPTDEEGLGLGEPIDPNAPKTNVAATFLPGIDAASILALLAAALGAGAFLLVNPLVQAHDAARTWSDFKNNVPRTKQDPFGLQRDWVSYQSWAQIIMGLVAVLLALMVLALWTARRNKLRSRSFAQAALVLGLAVLLYGILLKTGAVGSEIPSLKDISTGLSSSSQ